MSVCESVCGVLRGLRFAVVVEVAVEVEVEVEVVAFAFCVYRVVCSVSTTLQYRFPSKRVGFFPPHINTFPLSTRSSLLTPPGSQTRC